MELKFPRVLHRQFAGTRITAFFDAIAKYFKEMTDEKIAYFSTLRIQSANTQHLNMIGKLMSFPRPYIYTVPYLEQLFRFTNGVVHNTPTGFAGRIEGVWNVGGYLDEEFTPAEDQIQLNDEQFKKLLVAFSTYANNRESIALLDSILNQYFTGYEISWEGNNSDIRAAVVSETTSSNILIVQKIADVIWVTSPKVIISQKLQ